MKSFNNIQELWECCLFCPFCLDNCREITISVHDGYDPAVSKSFKKEDNILTVYYLAEPNADELKLTFDCTSNKFEIESIPIKENTPPPILDQYDIDYTVAFSALDYKAYLAIHSLCVKCNKSQASSEEIVLNLFLKEIQSSFEIQREIFYFLQDEDKFHVTLLYHNKSMIVSKFEQLGESVLSDIGNVLHHNLMEIDLSNINKIISKLKTLLLFS